MVLFHHFAQARVIDVCVDLCCRNIRMTEQFLHHTQVRAARKQVRGEAVSQFVRMHMLKPLMQRDRKSNTV